MDVVWQSMLSDSQYFQTANVFRQPLLSDRWYGQTVGQYRLWNLDIKPTDLDYINELNKEKRRKIIWLELMGLPGESLDC